MGARESRQQREPNGKGTGRKGSSPTLNWCTPNAGQQASKLQGAPGWGRNQRPNNHTCNPPGISYTRSQTRSPSRLKPLRPKLQLQKLKALETAKN